MENSQLTDIQKWFDTYVAGMYTSDEKINANLKLKDDHSRRTAQEMLYLAQTSKLAPADILLAQAIGLLHDIGRFEQFVEFRTYNDARSTSHSKIGLRVLREHFVLRDLAQADMAIVETAIEYHGVKEVPAGITGRRLHFTKMIRDCDKIDIYVVALDAYKKYQQDPDNFKLEVEFPPSGGCSPEVINCVRTGQKVDYRIIKTMDDFRLLQLGWVYDMNFDAALKRVKDRGCLDELAAMLPQDDDDVKQTIWTVMKYVEDRIKASGLS